MPVIVFWNAESGWSQFQRNYLHYRIRVSHKGVNHGLPVGLGDRRIGWAILTVNCWTWVASIAASIGYDVWCSLEALAGYMLEQSQR